MGKTSTFVLILLAVQVLSAFGNNSIFFDINLANIYQNAGNCYIFPGVGTISASTRIGYRYYSLPIGWRQYQDKVFVPDALTLTGKYTFGLRVTDDVTYANGQYQVIFDGGNVRISTADGISDRVLIPTYRTTSSSSWVSFTDTLYRRDGWFVAPEHVYWYSPASVSVTTTANIRSAPSKWYNRYNVLVEGFAPVETVTVYDYVNTVYGSQKARLFEQLYKERSRSSVTFYPVSTVTINAIYGRSKEGIIVPNGYSYLSGISQVQIGQHSVPPTIVSDFDCSDDDDIITGYGRVTSVQPGYIIVTSRTGGDVVLRVGECSRLEADRNNFILNTYDVFYRGRPSVRNELHLRDLTCISTY